MGFTSQDDLINQITTNGKTDTVVYQKTLAAAAVAGAWTDFGVSGGSIPASTYAGASRTFVATDDTWSEGTIYTGGDKSPATKHFLSAGGSLYNATGAPWCLMAVDMVGYVPLSGTDVSTTGAKTITMTPISNTTAKVDRYPNGEGLRMYVSANGAMGANAPTCIVNYTNSLGTTGRATIAFTSTASGATGLILNSGAAANKFNPFLGLAAGDTGISDIETLTWSGTAHASGSAVIHLVKPLFTIPVPANGIHTMLDFVNALPSLRKIPDGANIRFICFHTAATPSGSTAFVNFDYAWGG